MRREGREPLVHGLLVAEIGDHARDLRQLASLTRWNRQRRVPEHNAQPHGLEEHGLAPHVGAAHHQQPLVGPERDVERHHSAPALALGQQRMPRAIEPEPSCTGVERNASDLARPAGARAQRVEVDEHLLGGCELSGHKDPDNEKQFLSRAN